METLCDGVKTRALGDAVWCKPLRVPVYIRVVKEEKFCSKKKNLLCNFVYLSVSYTMAEHFFSKSTPVLVSLGHDDNYARPHVLSCGYLYHSSGAWEIKTLDASGLSVW